MAKENKESEVIWEAGASEAKGGIICKCIKGFFLQTVSDGPSVVTNPGQLVGLSPTMAAESFHVGKVMPHSPGIPKVGIYAVRIPFVVVHEGKYKGLEPGMELELTQAEAITHLLKSRVRLIKEVQDNEIKNA